MSSSKSRKPAVCLLLSNLGSAAGLSAGSASAGEVVAGRGTVNGVDAFQSLGKLSEEEVVPDRSIREGTGYLCGKVGFPDLPNLSLHTASHWLLAIAGLGPARAID
ncbi:hypothetical protein V8F06_014268 [Rhypophila decipiens]